MGRRNSPTLDALLIGAGLPGAVLLIVCAVFVHCHLCEWDAPSNLRASESTDDSRIICFIYGSDEFWYVNHENGEEEFSTAGAFMAGIVLPGLMLVGGVLGVTYIWRFVLLRPVRRGLPWRIEHGRVRWVRIPVRLQFSLLSLLVLTTFVAIAVAVAMEIHGDLEKQIEQYVRSVDQTRSHD
ncbi:MAG: hypothetical protein HQ581_09710 [Planctomycetes bacterium]|nr:hypothetical protein [Planctomycetota bacterium]